MVLKYPKKTNSKLQNLLHRVNIICLKCNESSDINDLFNNSLEIILELLSAKSGYISILDRQTERLTLKISVNPKPQEQENILEFLNKKLTKSAEDLKNPLLIENIQNYPIICLPLTIKNQLLGIISISEKSSSKPFSQREILLLEFLASQIAFNYQRILMSQQTVDLKRQIESQERLVSLGKLAGGIAHEFNNPLDGVMRYTNLCLPHAQDNDVLREYLMEIQQGLKRMANIVRNLLACARNSPGTAQKENVHKIIEQALKEVYPYLATKNITLVKNFNDTIPEITDWGLERIISNLVKNGIDAIERNGTIEITTGMDKDFIEIQVSDTGKGISAKDIDKIFEPFYTTKDIDKGCGLGLTIVSELVKYYNGKIKVKSRQNHGTTFTIKIPINS